MVACETCHKPIEVSWLKEVPSTTTCLKHSNPVLLAHCAVNANLKRKILQLKVDALRTEQNQIQKHLNILRVKEKSHPCCLQKDEDGVPLIRIAVHETETGFDYICRGCNETVKTLTKKH